MKYLIKMILAVVLLLPITVAADMGAPAPFSYEAVVTNSNGANYYEDGFENGESVLKKVGTLDFGTKFMTIKDDDSEYAFYYYQNEEFSNVYYIKKEDIGSSSDSFLPKTDEKIKDSLNVVVLKDNVYLHSPSKELEIMGNAIPKNTKLKITYINKPIESGQDYQWFYTSYNGESGWIKAYEGNIGFPYEGNKNKSVITETMILCSDIGECTSNNIIAKAKNSDEVTVLYNLDYLFSNQYYVEYDGKYGYMNINLGNKVSGKIQLINDVEVYKYSWPMEEKDLVGTLKKGTIVDVSLKDNENQGGLDLIYVKSKSMEGWINNCCDGEISKVIEEIVPVESQNEINNDVDEEPNVDKNKKDDVIVISDDGKTFTLREIIIFSIAGAIILALTTFIIILLANKKKQKNDITIISKENQSNSNPNNL